MNKSLSRIILSKRSSFHRFLVAGLMLLWGMGMPFAKEQSVSLSSTVEVGASHTTRLNNLPKGAFLSIRVEASADVAVLLINHADFEAYPAIKKPVFYGRTSNKALKFGVQVPESGKYYLVLGNRTGKRAVEFTLSVTASTDKTEKTTEQLSLAYGELEQFEENLRRFFAFDDLEFRIADCGTANAFSGEDVVTICTDIGLKILTTANDEQMARDVMMFVMVHEMGHILLRQWGYPFYDNEEVADEFATALLVMFNQKDRARSQAEYFSRLSPESEFERKRSKDERHPLSVQRSRNITRWLDDPELIRRWQKILVPHMQTTVLRALRLSPRSWTDQELVKKELALRSR